MPRAAFDHGLLADFHQRWDDLVAAYDAAESKEGRWEAVDHLQRNLRNPAFVKPGFRSRRFLPWSVGIFDDRGHPPEHAFWHWIPYSPEPRMILNVDPAPKPEER